MGVVLAQQFGVRVHLVGIHPARFNQSRSLMQEADTTTEWDEAILRTFLVHTPPDSTAAAANPAMNTGLDALVEQMIDALARGELDALKLGFVANSQIPADHDKALLQIGRAHYGQGTLSTLERSTLRSTFVRLVLAK